MLRKIALVCMVCFMTLAFGQVAGAVELVEHKEIKTDNISVLVPFIKSAKKSSAVDKINTLLSSDATEYLNDFKTALVDDVKEVGADVVKQRYAYKSTYAVKFNNKGLVSIINYGYTYTGGAHGSSWKRAVTADVNTGEVYKLPDLFKTGSNYKNVIDSAVRRQISADQHWKTGLDFQGIDENTKFYITGEILVVYYDAYDIGAYVMGAPEFYIPLRDLDDYLKEDISQKRYV